MKTKQLAPHPLRIPPEMKAELQHSATQARRSLSAEILIRLERTLQSDEGWEYHPETRAWTMKGIK